MSSAVEIASLYTLLSLKDEMSGGLDAAEQKAKGFGERISSLGDNVRDLGLSMSALTGPFIAGMGIATNEFLQFDSNMTNVQSVLGETDDAMALMSAEVLRLGENSRSGAQASAEAMYEIAGGVADASSHLAILETSLDVATANSANLDGAVSALVKTMNIYGYAAEDAAHVGDVFTRTIGMGVGTADEFAAALPPVEGLAKELGISFDDLGGYMAYMSTQSASVAEGGTQLRGVFSKMMNPSGDLAKAIKNLGYESGEAMVEQEGLIKSLELLKKYGGGSFAGLITDQEALLGAIALTKDGADEFLDTFSGEKLVWNGLTGTASAMITVQEGIEGATQAAKDIQMSSAAAQLDLLKNSLGGLAISVGQSLEPAISDLVAIVGPIVGSIKDWVRANPDLVKQIGTVIGVVGALGAGLTALGVALGVVGGAFTALTSPIGLALALGTALVAAYMTDFGGFATFVDGTIRPVIDTLIGGFQYLGQGIGWFLSDVEGMGLVDALRSALGWGTNSDGWFEGVLVSFGMARETAENAVNGIHSALMTLVGAWDAIRPGLEAFANWFVSDGLPGIGNVISGIWTGVIQPFFNFLGNVWAVVGPALGKLASWFVSDGLPGIVGAAEDVKAGVEGVFNWFSTVWTETLQPGLQPIVDWFTSGEAWKTIVGAANDVKTAVEGVFNWFSTVWTETLQPGLQPIVDWFTSGEAWKTITGAVNDVKTAVEGVFNWFSTVWTETLQPGLQPIVDWFTSGEAWQTITGAVNDVKTAVEGVFNWFSTVWSTIVKPGLDMFVAWFFSGEEWQSIVGAVEDVKGSVETIFNWFASVWTETLQPALQPIVDWFTGDTGLQQAGTAANDVKEAIDSVFTWLSTVWLETIQPGIQPIVDWFTSGTGWQEIVGAVQTVRNTINEVVGGIITKIKEFITTVEGVWGAISGAVNNIRSGIENALGPVKDIIQGISDALTDVVNAATGASVTVGAGGSPAGNPMSRDVGGSGFAGEPVLIGTGAQPELFIPRTAGTFHPASHQASGGGGTQIAQVIIQAETEAGGRAAADGFERRLQEIREGRG